MTILPAFIDHPKHIRFKEQESDESIELFLRQHWSVNISWFIISVFGYFTPIAIISADNYFKLGLINLLPLKTIIGFIILWYMFVTAYVIEKFLYWYFNVYIVTNQNIVDINFDSILSRDIVEVRLEDIESQASAMRGLKSSIFGYGDVHIESASESQKIDFESVPNPDAVADRIQDLRRSVPGGGKND